MPPPLQDMEPDMPPQAEPLSDACPGMSPDRPPGACCCVNAPAKAKGPPNCGGPFFYGGSPPSGLPVVPVAYMPAFCFISLKRSGCGPSPIHSWPSQTCLC